MRRLRVQTDERLVEDHQLRLVDERGDDGQLLLHSMRIGGNGVAQFGGQFKRVRIFLHVLLLALFVHPIDVGNEIDVLKARHTFIQIGIVGQIGDLLFEGNRVLADGDAVERDFALLKGQNAGNGLDRRRLSGAVVADKAENVAVFDRQRQVLYGGLAGGVGFGEILNAQHDCPPVNSDEKALSNLLYPIY